MGVILEKKSRQAHYFLYKEKEKKKLQYLMPIVFRISGDLLHTPSKLCFQSTGNKYHNILDAYAGYKKQKAKLQKKSRRAHYFKYKEILQYLMSIVFRISGDILHTPSKLCLQSTGNKYHNILEAYAGYKKLRVILEKKVPTGSLFFYKEKKKKKKKPPGPFFFLKKKKKKKKKS